MDRKVEITRSWNGTISDHRSFQRYRKVRDWDDSLSVCLSWTLRSPFRVTASGIPGNADLVDFMNDLSSFRLQGLDRLWLFQHANLFMCLHLARPKMASPRVSGIHLLCIFAITRPWTVWKSLKVRPCTLAYSESLTSAECQWNAWSNSNRIWISLEWIRCFERVK
jgi:hypothetical protein